MKRCVLHGLLICTLTLLGAISGCSGMLERSTAYLDKERAPRGKGCIKLYNGKDLEGWKFFPEDRKSNWKAVDGVMAAVEAVDHRGTNAYTTQKFADFEFYCEFKVPKGGNSGIFLRGLFEIQIRGDYGMKLDDPGLDWGTGAFYGQKKPLKNVSKPADEWQSVYAKVVGDKATVYVNSQLVQENYVLARPTHRYGEMSDIKEAGPGPIILQGDHKPIEYRHVMIKPIEKPAEKK